MRDPSAVGKAAQIADRDPEPNEVGLRKWAQISLIGLFVLALLGVATVTGPVLVPVIVAAVIGTILMPIVAWAEKRGVGRVLASVVLTLALGVAAAAVVVVLAMPVSYWIGRASEFGALIRERLGGIDRPLSAVQQILSAFQDVTGGQRAVVAVDTSRANIVETVLGVVTPAFGQFLLFVGGLIFYLVYHPDIKKGAVLFFRDREVRLRVLPDNTFVAAISAVGGGTVFFVPVVRL
jgi:predicted PurR-regulated permease PerM